MKEIIGIVVVGLFLVVVTTLSGTVVFAVVSIVAASVRKRIQMLRPLQPTFRKLLVYKFPYYNRLNQEQKKDFEKRLKYFLTNKKFIARSMPEVTDEMKVLIGACAVQITFGYKPLKFAHFDKIILYPSKYYSHFSKRNHKGEVNPNGMIVLSWEHFLSGYNIPDDGFNLGLHEMAHALRLEDAIQDGEYAFLDNKSLSRWHRASLKEIRKIRRGKGKFLRRYAATNAEEFFAVCIEQFFEQPHEFKQALPDLYEALSELLKQDPTTFYKAHL